VSFSVTVIVVEPPVERLKLAGEILKLVFTGFMSVIVPYEYAVLP
jgi:hypothetical protein